MDPAAPVAAVVVAALAAAPDPSLEELVGPRSALNVRDALAARARRWAAAVAPDRAYEATTLGAAEAAVHGHDGPLLLAAPDVPALSAALARAALEDIAAGCDVVVGASHDARPYLVGVRRPEPELIEIAGETFGGGLLVAFAQRGGVLGMLRSERRLSSAEDARALALDPLAPPDLRAILGLPGPRPR